MRIPSRLVVITVICSFAGLPLARDRAFAGDKPASVPADHAENMQKGLALFKEHVRPVLIAKCLDCHGGKSKKADFDLSDRAPLVASGAIEGGGKGSQLYAVIAHTEEPHMPQKAPKLADTTIEQIARWIDLGAPYDKPLIETAATVAKKKSGPTVDDRNFWSFRPLQVAPPPRVSAESWVRSPVDRFILAKLEQKSLAPNQPADRRVLIRRAYLDLLGLPPTSEETDAFIADASPSAYDTLIDRLLDAPQYGERWARHFLDVARFAESHGYEQDYDRPYAFHYRDFLIKALNQDLPYDQLIRWQIAGDELAPSNPLALAATGFLGAGAFPTQLTEAEFESARYNELDDMTGTTSSAFLGLSVGCARCHDHKFDPISSDDYYRIAATFTSTIRSEIDVAFEPGQKPTRVQITAEGYPHTKHHADDRGFPHKYPKTFVLNRGDVNQKKSEATPGFLAVLERDGKTAKAWRVAPSKEWTRSDFHRASLANWMTDTQHGAGHLAARVIVNRIWQHHFGRGIVATPNDFGAQGEPPSHPELLDWLAVDLIHNGWHLKRLHKQIVTSAVYMQESTVDEPRAKLDRENTLLWHYPPRRLEAEAIRDTLLATAGLLDKTLYGPGTLDQNHHRRAIYFMIKRSQLIPMMMLFDWPEHLVSIGQRSSTTIAPQALMFMNSPLGRQCAEGLADRLSGTSTDKKVAHAYKIALGRDPSPAELKLSTDFLDRQKSAYERDKKREPDRLALVDLCQAILSMSELIYIP